MEAEFLAWLRDHLPPRSDLPLGLVDDAALITAETHSGWLTTVDLLTEGVDFRLAEVDARRVGRKALAVNLSDMAAMAAEPVAALVSLALPRDGALELAKTLYEGLLPLAGEYGVAVAGGDVNTWDGGLVISVTVFGRPTGRGPLKRSGASAGDVILLTGQLGGSILGHHFDFEPRVREAIALHERYKLSAGMDISDGLLLDLSRLAEASRCGAVLDLPFVPISPAAQELAAKLDDGSTALDHALGDGEDFELLFAAAPSVAQQILTEQPLGVPVTAIGRFVSEPGLWAAEADGRRAPLEPRGYQHR